MKPELDRFLEVAAAHLMMKTAPALGPGYEQSSAMSLAVLLIASREEANRAAARRVEENSVLRALFADAENVVSDKQLAARLSDAAASPSRDESMLVTDLEAANGVLRGLLIELHSHVEELDSPDSRRIESEIWRELAASTERRRLSLGPF
jgi:hypothetical protein